VPYGTPAAALGAWLVHTIVVDRAGVARPPQAVHITPHKSGQFDAPVGQGFVGRSGGYEIYGPPGLDIAVGDTFMHNGQVDFDPENDDGVLFRVEWVSLVGWAPMDGATMRVVYAEAVKGVG